MKDNKTNQMCFRVTDEEKHNLKVLAAKQGKTFKKLLFSALDKQYPNWNQNEQDISK